jgi:hypothetical protein
MDKPLRRMGELGCYAVLVDVAQQLVSRVTEHFA